MTMTSSPTTSPARRAAINALALVGFVVLIIIGMTLAIYAASFVPKAVTRLNSAAVYLSSIFVSADKPDLQVVTPGTEIPFGETPGAGIATTTVATTTTPVAPKPVAPTPSQGTPTSTVYPTGGTAAPTLSGLSDLKVTIVSTGYLTTNDTASFVASKSVPNGMRGAVKFTVTNIGTNTSGRFTFKAVLPTTSAYTFNSDQQDALLPGEHIDYVLGFDRARTGTDREITITVDASHNIVESNENNNEATATVEIK